MLPRRCGSHAFGTSDQAHQHAALMSFAAATTKQNEQQLQKTSNSSIVTIPVCFHIFGKHDILQEQMQQQLNILNLAFKGNLCCDTAVFDWCQPLQTETAACSTETNFRFQWAVYNTTKRQLVRGVVVPEITDNNDACILYHHRAYTPWRWSVRKGDASVLNIYWKNLGGVLGYATVPWQYWWTGPLQVDGVTIDHGAIVGGRYKRYNLGRTAVHEVGHWLGLDHTWQGGCARSDGIYDTAPEAKPFYGCEAVLERDTCPGDNRTDPTTNYMNYADDACMYQFTPGQAKLMQAVYQTYRQPKTHAPQENESTEIILSNNRPSDPIFISVGQSQVFVLKTTNTTASSVTCTVSVAEGKASLSLKWSNRPYILLGAACSNTNQWFLFGKRDSCTARFRFGATHLYAIVAASTSRPLQNLTVTCAENV